MKVAGFFAGIGGIELGLHQAGHETAFLCDVDLYSQQVLRDRFELEPLGDISAISADLLPSGVEMVTAGFPCQDLSQAGRTQGIAGAKSGLVRHLFRILAERRIPWLLIENVPFMLQLDRGGAMQYLVESLEGLGYSWAYRVLDSRAFGLPQRRQRVFLLASREEDPARLLFRTSVKPVGDPHTDLRGRACGFYWTEGLRGLGWAVDAIPTLKGGSTVGIPSPPAVWMPGGRNGNSKDIEMFKPGIRDAERLQGFERDWTLPAERVDRKGHRYRWKLVGNAVSVNAAKWVGEQLGNSVTSEIENVERLDVSAPWPKAAFGSRGGRWAVPDVTTWPCNIERPALRDFIEDPDPLSLRATSGFKSRFEQGSLRSPDGFLKALDRHIAAVQRTAVV